MRAGTSPFSERSAFRLRLPLGEAEGDSVKTKVAGAGGRDACCQLQNKQAGWIQALEC